MRLDLFLKKTRIIKRRSVGKQMCDDNFVFVNGKLAKASYEVKKGDRLSIYFKEKRVDYLVIDIPNGVIRTSGARSFYKVLGEEVYEEG